MVFIHPDANNNHLEKHLFVQNVEKLRSYQNALRSIEYVYHVEEK